MERLCSTKDSCKGLNCDSNDVVVRLLRGQSLTTRLSVETQLARFRIPGFETVLHYMGPDSTRSSELRNLLQEIVPTGEEEGELGSELVYLESSIKSRPNVFNSVCKTESQFLDRVRARLTDVIATDADRVPARHFVGAVFYEVDGQLQRCLWRIDVRVPRDVLLQNIILRRSPQLVLRNALFHSNGNIQRKQDWCSSVDCHARADPTEVDALEETPHVMHAADCDSNSPNFSRSPRMIRVKTELCWQVEGRAKPSLTVRYQILEAAISFSRGTKTRVLTHGPQPVPIHSIVDATRVWKLAWFSQRFCPVQRNVFVFVEFLDRYTRVCCHGIRQAFSPIFAMISTSLDAAVSGSSSRLTTLPTNASSSF